MQGLAHQQGGSQRHRQGGAPAVPGRAAAAALGLRRRGPRLPRTPGHCHRHRPRTAGRPRQPRCRQRAQRGRGAHEHSIRTAGRGPRQREPLGQLDVAVPLAEGRGRTPLPGRGGPLRLLLRAGHQRAYGQGLALHDPEIPRRHQGHCPGHRHRQLRRRGHGRAQGRQPRAGRRTQVGTLPHRLLVRRAAPRRQRLRPEPRLCGQRRAHVHQR